jgi:hypothetical protein
METRSELMSKLVFGLILMALLSIILTVNFSYSLLGQSNQTNAAGSNSSLEVKQTPESTTSSMSTIKSETPNIEKVSEFFSVVVGLNMSNSILIESSPTYTEGMPSDFRVNYTAGRSTFGGLVNVSVPSYILQFNQTSLEVKSEFINEQLAFWRIEPYNRYLLSETEESNLVKRAQIMLEGYQTYVKEMYGDNGSYLEPILAVLKNSNYFAPENATLNEVNLQFQISDNLASVRWVYCPDGVIMNGKYLELSFEDGVFSSLDDTWRFYNSIEISKVSPREAFDTALEAAQKVEVHMVLNGSDTTYKGPDLSNARYDADLYVVKQSVSWHFIFYFNEPIFRAVGVEADVWGDTGELIDCHSYFVHEYP